MRYITTLPNKEYQVEVIDENHVVVDGVLYDIDFQPVANQPIYSLLVDGRSFEAFVYPTEEGWQVLSHGNLYPAQVEDEREKRLRTANGNSSYQGSEYMLKSPMPGLIVSVMVQDGQEVKEGDVLVVLESMKMQNQLKSPINGVVSRLRVQAGDNVEQRQVLLVVG